MSAPDEPDRPSVSFLCCAYRTEDTVVETIESVRAQTRDDWQLVVVDNGPSDEMARIVEPYLADPRVVLIRQPNAFAAGGVNAAGRAAVGRYVAVLHTDDLVEPMFMERLVTTLDGLPDVHVLTPDARFLTKTGVRRPTFREPVPAAYRQGAPVTLREMVEGWIPYYTGLVRKEVWDAIGGFRHDTPAVEDLSFFVDLLTAGYVHQVLEEPLALYRESENSDSRGARGVEVMEDSFERVVTAAVDEIGTAEDRAALAVAIPRSRHRRATVRARRLLLEGDVPGAREAAEAALAHRPDARTRGVVLALRWAPRLLLLLYRVKKALHRWRSRLSTQAALHERDPGQLTDGTSRAPDSPV
ncbi:glycosyltransferase family A protein [Nocardioides sp.]|uniref:glycosyltransferase family A protein n=1 Tax=Nocardioides sp. TaxID=35761 RepID=UPI00271A72BE|nr:glycosyltransferase family A protein [Nocardioides sp.]MDO9457687.1 glycosyltransferase family A protein [Nocardioides sp.]